VKPFRYCYESSRFDGFFHIVVGGFFAYIKDKL
jgi:hypothetical protein